MGPINTPRHFSDPSDLVFLSTLCSLLSALEVDGLSSKCPPWAHNSLRSPPVPCAFLSSSSGVTDTLPQDHSHLVSGTLTNYFGFTNTLFRIYSHSTPGVLTLQAYSYFTLSALALYSVNSHTLLQVYSLLTRVYSHFTLHLCPWIHTLYSRLYHT